MEKLITVLILIGIFAIAAFSGWLFWKIYDWKWQKLEQKERELHPNFFELQQKLKDRQKRFNKLKTRKNELQKEILELNKERLFVPHAEGIAIEAQIYSLQKEYKANCEKLEILKVQNERIREELSNYRKKWNLKT